MTHLPHGNVKVRAIIVQWRLAGDIYVALEVPTPIDNSDDRERLADVIRRISDALDEYIEEDAHRAAREVSP